METKANKLLEKVREHPQKDEVIKIMINKLKGSESNT